MLQLALLEAPRTIEQVITMSLKMKHLQRPLRLTPPEPLAHIYLGLPFTFRPRAPLPHLSLDTRSDDSLKTCRGRESSRSEKQSSGVLTDREPGLGEKFSMWLNQFDVDRNQLDSKGSRQHKVTSFTVPLESN